VGRAQPGPQPNACATPPCAPTPALQQGGDLEKSRAAYERAAQSQDKLGSGWHAAKHLETAAQLSRDLLQWGAAADFARQAAAAYAQAGRPTAGEGAGLGGARLRGMHPGRRTGLR
jgi:hypothetical protein